MLEQPHVCAFAGTSSLAVMLTETKNLSQTFSGDSYPDASLEMFKGVEDPSRRKGWWGRRREACLPGLMFSTLL